MMNAMNVPSKRSTPERKLDKVIATLFGVLLSMCLIGAIGSAVFVSNKYHYLELWINGDSEPFNPNNRFVVFVLSIFTLITLYYSNFFLCFYRGGFMVLGGMNLIQICARKFTDASLYVIPYSLKVKSPWKNFVIQAKSSRRDRERKLDEVAELIEKELTLIGCIAIEDKLQERVPSCIETLSRAGIRI